MGLYKDWLLPLGHAIVKHRMNGVAYALGDQQTYFTYEYAKARLQRHGLLIDPHVPPKPDHVTPELVAFETVLRMLGIADYRDIDVNAGSALTLDLSAPVPDELAGAADLVLDLGTTEHILDVGQAFANIVRLIKPRGWVIHGSPVTWFEHGFYNFNPLLLKELYEYNGFQVLEHGLILQPFSGPLRFVLDRFELHARYNRSNWTPFAWYVRADKYALQLWSEYLFQFPRSSIFFAARKGATDPPVRFPIQRIYRDSVPASTHSTRTALTLNSAILA